MSDDDKIVEEKTEKEQEAEMEVVHASLSNVVAKPKDVEERANKAIASNLNEEEKKKLIEDNVLGDIDD